MAKHDFGVLLHQLQFGNRGAVDVARGRILDTGLNNLRGVGVRRRGGNVAEAGVHAHQLRPDSKYLLGLYNFVQFGKRVRKAKPYGLRAKQMVIKPPGVEGIEDDKERGLLIIINTVEPMANLARVVGVETAVFT